MLGLIMVRDRHAQYLQYQIAVIISIKGKGKNRHNNPSSFSSYSEGLIDLISFIFGLYCCKFGNSFLFTVTVHFLGLNSYTKSIQDEVKQGQVLSL